MQNGNEMQRRILRALYPEWNTTTEPFRTTENAKQVHVHVKPCANDQTVHSYHGLVGYCVKERVNHYSKVWVLGEVTNDDLNIGIQIQKVEGRKTSAHRFTVAPNNIHHHLASYERNQYGFGSIPSDKIDARVLSLLTESPCELSADWFKGQSTGLDKTKFAIAMKHTHNRNRLTLNDVNCIVFNEGLPEEESYFGTYSTGSGDGDTGGSDGGDSDGGGSEEEPLPVGNPIKRRKKACRLIDDQAMDDGDDEQREDEDEDAEKISGSFVASDVPSSQLTKTKPKTPLEETEGIDKDNIIPEGKSRRARRKH